MRLPAGFTRPGLHTRDWCKSCRHAHCSGARRRLHYCPPRIRWVDGNARSADPPDPAYPFGADVDVSLGAVRSCSTPLPYAAGGIGHYEVHCPTCGLTVLCSTAGGVDDPRSLRMACKPLPPEHGRTGSQTFW
jgi:hypothetical protein